MTEFFIPGYRELSPIYESVSSRIFRARREADSLPVILKWLREDCPSAQERVRYLQEWKIVRALQGRPGVIRALGLEKLQSTFFLVLEDLDAVSVSQWMASGEPSLRQRLEVAVHMTRCLEAVHRASVIHKDVNPSNFVYNPGQDAMRIIDFGISTQLQRERIELCSLEVLEGSLPYLSPEQTGRTNRAVDTRADFYSLGVTLYQLFTGRLPFESEDPVELLHGHILRQPLPPHLVDPQIPKALSGIVRKLLAKMPEERYQSAWGLLTDLRECLGQLQQSGTIEAFPLGRHDPSERLLVPEILYGREQETATLAESFERVTQGAKVLSLLAGHSGVGKTALVQELFRPLTLRRGTYLTGKFGALQRDVPYSAFVSAFAQLVRTLLTEPEPRLQAWQREIRKALGHNAGVISVLIPQIERLIGPQPAVEELAATESQNRFSLVFLSFLSVFARAEHPLILFVDDLQWADGASLKLIRLIMTAPEIGYFHLIGAYRDNEVSPTHPLLVALGALQRSGVKIGELTLAPLSLPDVHRLLSQTLGRDDPDARRLSALIQEKTGGNPFFINAFLAAMASSGPLWLDEARGGWEFCLEEIGRLGITDNVADFLVARMQKLAEETQQLLMMAACIGFQFDLEALSVISWKSGREMIALLEPALCLGYVLPLGPEYKAIEHDAPSSQKGLTARFKFAHDRIQQAAYSLIPEVERAAVHWQIGKLLLKRQLEGRGSADDFEIINHLNRSATTLQTAGEQRELARFNLHAGKKAKAAAAYEEAVSYLSTAWALLGERSWESAYRQALETCQEGAEAAYLSADFPRMEGFIQEVLAHARDLPDQTGVVRVRILCELSQSHPAAAIEAGIAFLQRLGVPIPAEPRRFQVVFSLLRVRWSLVRMDIERIVDLSTMTRPDKLAAIEIMRAIGLVATVSQPYLTTLLTCKEVELLFAYGNNAWSGSVVASLGATLCGVLGDISTGYRMGELALTLLAKHATSRQRCRTLLAVHFLVKHWKDPLGSTRRPLMEAYLVGLESGDFEFASLSAHACCHTGYFLGEELGPLAQEMAGYSAAIGRMRQHSQLVWNEMFLQAVHVLQGRSRERTRLVGEVFDEAQALPALIQSNNRSGIACFYYLRMFLACLFQEHHLALENAELVAGYLTAVPSLFALTRVNFYDSLSRLGEAATQSPAVRGRLLKKVAANQRQLGRWARFAEKNHRNAFELVEAERLRVLGRSPGARAHYERAISAAREGGFVHEEALSYELAGRFLLEEGEPVKAQAHLLQARYLYQKWGASAKVADLDERHGALLSGQARPARLPMSVTPGDAPGAESALPGPPVFDLGAVLQALQAISGEIEMERLSQKILQIAIDHTGAQQGCLVLKHESALVVEAILQGSAAFGGSAPAPLPLERFEGISAAIVCQVLGSGKTVVLGNAAESAEFGQDPHVLGSAARSILCCPIVGHGAPIGALFLEDNRAVDVFSAERVEILGHLSAQAAISIENARQYRMLGEALSRASEGLRAREELLARASEALSAPLQSIIELPEVIVGKISAQPALPGAPRRYEGDLGEVIQIQKTIQEAARSLLSLVDDLHDISQR